MDPELKILFGVIGGILLVATLIGALLAKIVKTDGGRATVANLNARTRSWWIMAGIFSATILMGHVFTTVLFGCLSFLALREFITLNQTERADHGVLHGPRIPQCARHLAGRALRDDALR